MNFDILSFILGKLNCGSNFNDVVSYLMGKAVRVVTEVVQDIYNELRSAPIHTSINIEGNVYPREDNTPLGLKTIKGRTVVNNDALVPCVVSGVEVTGFNQWDEQWEVGGYTSYAPAGTKDETTDRIRSKNPIPVLPNTSYYFRANGDSIPIHICYYDKNGTYISQTTGTNYFNAVYTTPANCYYLNFNTNNVYGVVYNHDICINLSDPSRNGEYRPYQHESLSIPSTALNGVGTAQDYIEAVEVGENDYSLIKHTLMGEVDLGTLDWNYHSSGNMYADDAISRNFNNLNAICSIYTLVIPSISAVDQLQTDKSFALQYNVPSRIVIRDTSYTDAAAFKTAMSGVMLVYELATPTETTIAEHLTLAEVSAIAQNGGIIGIVNSNGDIVQPDLTVTTVINKSAITN